jgi:hypothetical protein
MGCPRIHPAALFNAPEDVSAALTESRSQLAKPRLVSGITGHLLSLRPSLTALRTGREPLDAVDYGSHASLLWPCLRHLMSTRCLRPPNGRSDNVVPGHVMINPLASQLPGVSVQPEQHRE